MGIFVDAIKNREVTYDNGAAEVKTSYNFKDGYHNIKISGSGTNVSTKGEGNIYITHYGDNATISTDNDWASITSLGNNKTINTGDGDDEVIFIGDNVNVNTNKGNDSLVFWGNNCNLKLGEGNDSVTTYDQVYQHVKFRNLQESFINRLETGTWEDWQLKSSTIIDQYTKKKWTGKVKRTTVYEDNYNVTTYLARYINGVENCNIDMGIGKDTANVTLGKNSTINTQKSSTGNNDDTIVKNQKWQIDEYIESRDETKVRIESSSSWSWKTFVSPLRRLWGGILQLTGLAWSWCGWGIPLYLYGEDESRKAWDAR